MNKKIILIVISVITLIILYLIVTRIFLTNKENQSPANFKMMNRELAVNTIIVLPEPLAANIKTIGTILSNEEVELRSEVSGKIIYLNIAEGQWVKKGTLLVKINDADLKAQLKKLEVKINLARENEFRQKKLLEIEGTSQENYSNALSELNSVLADIELLKAQIDKTEIKAPFDGVVGLKYVSEGSYISPAVKIASFQNNNPVKIDFSIPQKYAHLIKAGESINFILTSTGKKYKAKIYALEPKIDPATRTMQLRAICQNPGNELIAGGYVEIETNFGNERSSLMIPTEALVPDISGEKVFIYRNGFAQRNDVVSGIRTEDRVEILDGLSPGDTVIISGILQLKPNLKVKIASVK
ncbi:MAG: efflux RND transporter periplasmic adaptor subunit [Ignavibacteriaceae bacterium]|nr:efflux RND transporter periplasmic adaptor subunit [Ignavibacteriaceae bacterium]